MLAGIDHIALETDDLARAEKFYTGLLGLSVVIKLPDQVLMRCGGQDIALFLRPRNAMTDEEKRALLDRPLGKAHISFRATWESYQRMRDAFRKNGIPHHSPIDCGSYEGCYFLDPDGNLLQIAGYKPPNTTGDVVTAMVFEGADSEK